MLTAWSLEHTVNSIPLCCTERHGCIRTVTRPVHCVPCVPVQHYSIAGQDITLDGETHKVIPASFLEGVGQ